MDIQHRQTDSGGKFFLPDESGAEIAELTYFFVDDNTINANHTYVSATLRGQGVADKLYQALIRLVREKNLNLIPTCSYIAKKWERENNTNPTKRG